jgi:hypothetical protein
MSEEAFSNFNLPRSMPVSVAFSARQRSSQQ